MGWLDAGLVDKLHVDRMGVSLSLGLRRIASSSLEWGPIEEINVQQVCARRNLRFGLKQSSIVSADFEAC